MRKLSRKIQVDLASDKAHGSDTAGGDHFRRQLEARHRRTHGFGYAFGSGIRIDLLRQGFPNHAAHDPIARKLFAG